MPVRLDDRNPSDNASFLLTIEGVPGYFSKASGGGGWSTERGDWSDGLTNIKRKAASGVTDFKDITLEKAFDPDKDSDLIAWCTEKRCALETETITLRPVKRCDGIEQRGSRSWVLSGARLKEFMPFDGLDTGDGKSVVMLKLTFTVESSEWV